MKGPVLVGLPLLLCATMVKGDIDYSITTINYMGYRSNFNMSTITNALQI
jgi:hypothetical protein